MDEWPQELLKLTVALAEIELARLKTAALGTPAESPEWQRVYKLGYMISNACHEAGVSPCHIIDEVRI